MIYSVIRVVNNEFNIYKQNISDLDEAKASYYEACKGLFKAESAKGSVLLVDNTLTMVESYHEIK